MRDREKIKLCFSVLQKTPSLITMLFVYFLSQVIISGLASFVVPFFSNRVFSSSSLKSLLFSSSVWFLFALLSTFIDYYGNRYNLRTYYRINEKQFKTHLSMVLKKRFCHLKLFSIEAIVSRLNDDSENIANIILWIIGILAMFFSCIVVLVWSVSLSPIVFSILFGTCILSVLSKRISDKEVAEYRDKRTRIEQELLELLSVANQDPLVLAVGFLNKAFNEARCNLYDLLESSHKKEGVWNGVGDASILLIDSTAKLICFYILLENGIVDSSIILPIFTIQSTFQNQLLTLLDNISSVKSNLDSVSRLFELENGDEYKSNCCLQNLKSRTVIKAEGITVQSSEGNTILNNISFEIKQNEKVAIIGSNGSGKTSLIRALLGLIPLKSGKAELYGDIGYCPVSPQLFEMSLNDNCNLIKNKNNLKNLSSDLRSLFPIQEDILCTENVCSLSLGQKRLASLFRSCTASPSIIILDEPTSSLSFETAKKVMDYFLRLPCTVLFICHDRALADKADRIIQISRGCIREQ